MPSVGHGSYSAPNVFSEVSLRVSAYSVLGFGTVLFYVFFNGTGISAAIAAILAVVAALLVQRSNRGRPTAKLMTIFFWLAAVHAIYGYWASANSTDAISIGSNAERMFQRSFYVIAATLVIASFSYDAFLQVPPNWAGTLRAHMQISERRLIRTARGFALLGMLCVLYVMVGAGFMPILASDPGKARYISDALGKGFQQYDWVLARGLELLTMSSPLVLCAALIHRKKWDWLIGILGVVGVLLTLKRAYLISIFVVFLLTISFVRRKFPRKHLVFLFLLGAAYFGSQLVFLNGLGDDSGATETIVLSALPEVRDLGWTMSLAGQERFYGATFLVPMIMGPGIASDFKTHYGLGYVTIRLAGYQGDATGGLRITFAGEGYLNFGIAGCLLVGSAFGILCAWWSHLSRLLLTNRTLASSYLNAALFGWLCFWLYLGGTANAEPIRNGFIGVIVMYVFSRSREAKIAGATVARP